MVPVAEPEQTPEDALSDLSAAITADQQARADGPAAENPEGNDMPPAVAEQLEETRQLVIRELRSDGGDTALAAKVEAKQKLNDEEAVAVDAIVHGTGFLVDGKRVSPSRVRMIRWDSAG